MVNVIKSEVVIFLDFDGVLHPAFPRSNLSDEENQFFSYKKNFEECIRKLLVTHNIKIVISSTWRENRDIPTLKAFFSKDIGALIIGKTPMLNGQNNREDECVYFMRFHKIAFPWIALDDYKKNFYHLDKLVFCPNHFKKLQAKALIKKVYELTSFKQVS